MEEIKHLRQCEKIMNTIENALEYLSLEFIGGSVYSKDDEKILFLSVESKNGAALPLSRLKKILTYRTKVFDINKIVLNSMIC